jgi:hypothetical protein
MFVFHISSRSIFLSLFLFFLKISTATGHRFRSDPEQHNASEAVRAVQDSPARLVFPSAASCLGATVVQIDPVCVI